MLKLMSYDEIKKILNEITDEHIIRFCYVFMSPVTKNEQCADNFKFKVVSFFWIGNQTKKSNTDWNSWCDFHFASLL